MPVDEEKLYVAVHAVPDPATAGAVPDTFKFVLLVLCVNPAGSDGTMLTTFNGDVPDTPAPPLAVTGVNDATCPLVIVVGDTRVDAAIGGGAGGVANPGNIPPITPTNDLVAS